MVDQISTLNCLNKSKRFSAHAAYYDSMDFIEYVQEDCTVIAERIDEVLTLLRKNNSKDYVGFKIKGFRNYFERNLRQKYSLDEEDFVNLKQVMETICAERSSVFMTANTPMEIKGAYMTAYTMAVETVELQISSLKQAA